jgi:hypothetical protein
MTIIRGVRHEIYVPDPNISRVVLRLTRAVNHSDRAVKPILGQTDVRIILVISILPPSAFGALGRTSSIKSGRFAIDHGPR